MITQIICHYTFHSNEIGSVAGTIFFIVMALIIIVALYIYIANKNDNYKLNKKWENRDKYLEDECEKYLFQEAQHDVTLRRIKENYIWKQWYIKGYKKGAISGNEIYSPFSKFKSHKESSFEEWENYELSQMEHIKEDSDYFGGNKKNAQMAYILGHELGVMRYEEKGPAE